MSPTSDPTTPSLRFQADSGDFVEVQLETDDGDLITAVEFSCSGFRGATVTWVLHAAWTAFAVALSELDVKRQGEARLTGIYEQELDLLVQSVDRAGQMAISGRLGLVLSDQTVLLEFSPMVFDPSQLPVAARRARAFTG